MERQPESSVVRCRTAITHIGERAVEAIAAFNESFAVVLGDACAPGRYCLPPSAMYFLTGGEIK
jgi:hypothetical protein